MTRQACPSKAKCCPNADARSITREEHEDARQAARDISKTRQYEISMKLRKKVEMCHLALNCKIATVFEGSGT